MAYRPGFIPGHMPNAFLLAQQLENIASGGFPMQQRQTNYQAALHQAMAAQWQNQNHHAAAAAQRSYQYGNMPGVSPAAYRGVPITVQRNTAQNVNQNYRQNQNVMNQSYQNVNVNLKSTSNVSYANTTSSTPDVQVISSNMAQKNSSTGQKLEEIAKKEEPEPEVYHPDVRVINIAQTASDPLLFSVFSACGQVVQWDHKLSKKTSNTWGVIKYKTAEDAARAIRVLRNHKLDGKKFILEPHNSKSMDVLKNLHEQKKSEWLKINKSKPTEDEFFLSKTDKLKDNASNQLIKALLDSFEGEVVPKFTLPLDEEEVNEEIVMFVGNLTSNTSDHLVFSLLSCCGCTLEWKRSKTNSGNKGTFGFAKFLTSEEALRARRLLNGKELEGKSIVVKADKKTKEILDQLLNTYKGKSTSGRKRRKRWNDDDDSDSDSDSGKEDNEITDASMEIKFVPSEVKVYDLYAKKCIKKILSDYENGFEEHEYEEYEGSDYESDNDDDVQEIPVKKPSDSPEIVEIGNDTTNPSVPKVEKSKIPEPKTSVNLESFLNPSIDQYISIPLVGLNFVVETRGPNSKRGEECEYSCALCPGSKINFGTVIAHVKALPHRLKFIKNCWPEMDKIYGNIPNNAWGGSALKGFQKALGTYEETHGRLKITVRIEEESSKAQVNSGRDEAKQFLNLENKSELSTSCSKTPESKAKRQKIEPTTEKFTIDRTKSTPLVKVSNISSDVTEFNLKSLFSKFGSVTHIRFDQDDQSAIVYYEEETSAAEAVKGLNGRSFRNKKLNVEEYVRGIDKSQQMWLSVKNVDTIPKLTAVAEMFSELENITHKFLFKHSGYAILKFENNDFVPMVIDYAPSFTLSSDNFLTFMYTKEDIKKLLETEFNLELEQRVLSYKNKAEEYINDPSSNSNCKKKWNEYVTFKRMIANCDKIDTTDVVVQTEWSNYWIHFVNNCKEIQVDAERKKMIKTFAESYKELEIFVNVLEAITPIENVDLKDNDSNDCTEDYKKIKIIKHIDTHKKDKENESQTNQIENKEEKCDNKDSDSDIELDDDDLIFEEDDFGQNDLEDLENDCNESDNEENEDKSESKCNETEKINEDMVIDSDEDITELDSNLFDPIGEDWKID